LKRRANILSRDQSDRREQDRENFEHYSCFVDRLLFTVWRFYDARLLNEEII
jgi:hypothetical protein